ncbi:MMPL family transporter [Cryptosporangium aurantiacum]|uniref:Putative drug exporter of the RND superfamily n=1 Tax=Cryptosporangium aurantiacum TaxID=134849 RepID=A0A1M7MUL4_9ACTN|nr:MMPL family transporter [Cryptosporangium aurantiacum]SHM94708.1 putative drug exporter of the RND superfamily [Cryptosporangium aurantiacum]
MTTELDSTPTTRPPEPDPPGWRRLITFPAGRRAKFLVILGWLVLAGIAGPLAASLTSVQNNDALTSAPHSSEAYQAQQRVEGAFPGADALVAVAVYTRDTGVTDADRAAVEADRAAFAQYALDGTVPAAVPSEDGQALLLSFPLAGDSDAQSDATTEIRDALSEDKPAGLNTALTGSAGADGDIFDAFEGMDLMLVLVTAGVVTVLLLVTYRSPVLWLIPLLTVAIASQVASAVVYLLAKNAGLEVNLQSQNILTILVFGAGTDYALLLISRYREELRRHEDRHQAMAVALKRSFPAILASAATVSLALLCLLFADLNGTRSLGPVAALGILAAFAAMTTLLPALIVVCGRWLFWPFVPRVGDVVEREPRVWSAVARLVRRAPGRVWGASAALLVVVAFGASTLSLGLPADETFTSEVGSVTGQRLVEQHYAGGTSAPAEIVVDADRAPEAVAAATGVEGVADVADARISEDGRTALIAATLADRPDSAAAQQTVERLRDAVDDTGAQVTGQTAAQLDTEHATDRDHRVLMPLILAVVFLVLVVLLRAIVAPLLLIASVVLSYAAAMGAAAVILHLIGYPRLEYSIVLTTFLFLVALGVDYSIFLMTRAREEVRRLGHTPGVLRGLTATGGVVTSAGVVLAATFAALCVLPLVPSVQIGVIVAVGVLLDTFVVRSLLVPALAVHVGPKIWWPGR